LAGLILAAAFGLPVWLIFGESGKGLALYGAGLLFGLGVLPSVIGFTWKKLGLNQLYWWIFIVGAVALSLLAGTAGMGKPYTQAVLEGSQYVTVTRAGGDHEDFLIQGSEVGNVDSGGYFVARGTVTPAKLTVDGAEYAILSFRLGPPIPFVGVGGDGVILITFS